MYCYAKMQISSLLLMSESNDLLAMGEFCHCQLLGFVWYICLKTKNCCLETFVKIRVGEKVR